ncbi:MAG: hypothetical protein IJN88_04800, partial [Clostridia bacterium]|nr:hypothetical protein [Clostridia bacterium]
MISKRFFALLKMTRQFGGAKDRVTIVIRTCLKVRLFSAFRCFGFERRQPVGNLNSQKSSENTRFSGRRFFI